MGLVLEEEQPILGLPLHVDRDLHRAGVDLLGLVQLVQKALLLKIFGGDGAHVHEGDRLGAAQLPPDGQIVLVGPPQLLVLEGHIVDDGVEGGVAAVVGPVGVHHLDLGDGGVPSLGAEIVAAAEDVAQVHGQAPLRDKVGQSGLVQIPEAVERLHGVGHAVIHGQRLRQLQRGQAAVHRVDDVLLDGGHLLRRQIAPQEIDTRRAHGGALAQGDDLDALGGRVGALVVLAGQILHGEDLLALPDGQVVIHVVRLGLAEHGVHRVAEGGLVDALHVVAVQEAQLLQGGDAQEGADILPQGAGLARQELFFLNVNAIYHRYFLSSARCPMSRR